MCGPRGEEIDTAAIVTVEPSLEISFVYDRMPAILRSENAIDQWLNTRDVGAREAQQLAIDPVYSWRSLRPAAGGAGLGGGIASRSP